MAALQRSNPGALYLPPFLCHNTFLSSRTALHFIQKITLTLALRYTKATRTPHWCDIPGSHVRISSQLHCKAFVVRCYSHYNIVTHYLVLDVLLLIHALLFHLLGRQTIVLQKINKKHTIQQLKSEGAEPKYALRP